MKLKSGGNNEPWPRRLTATQVKLHAESGRSKGPAGQQNCPLSANVKDGSRGLLHDAFDASPEAAAAAAAGSLVKGFTLCEQREIQIIRSF